MLKICFLITLLFIKPSFAGEKAKAASNPCPNSYKGKINDYISAPTAPSPTDELAKSIVNFGYVLKDSSDLPQEIKLINPINKFKAGCTATVIARKGVLLANSCRAMIEDVAKEFRQYVSIPNTKNLNVLMKALSKYATYYVVPGGKITENSHLDPKATQVAEFLSNPLSKGASSDLNRKVYDTAFLKLSSAIDIPPATVIGRNAVAPNNTLLRIYGYSWPGGDPGTLRSMDAKLPADLGEQMCTDPFFKDVLNNQFVIGQTGKFPDREYNHVRVPASQYRVACPGSTGGPVYANVNGDWKIISVISGSGSSFDTSCFAPASVEPKKAGESAMTIDNIAADRHPRLASQGAWFYKTLEAAQKW